MKAFTTLMILSLVSMVVQGQKLPSKIIDQPDGLTIRYFNSQSDSCLPEIFLGKDLKILYPCYSKANYRRADISSAKQEIKRLKEILTKNFITVINKCCMEKDCPDTLHGYYLMIKEGDNYNFLYLDISQVQIDKCGSKELNELIEILNKINKNYH